ncbi:Ribonuclease PH [Bienertia sinuspersici]
MVRLASRRQACETWERDDICPNIVKRIQVVRGELRTCTALFSGQGDGIPCKHGMRAILYANEDPLKYVSNCYSLDVYKRAYLSNIKAIPDQEQWPEMDMPEVTPHAMKRGIGRPSRNRRREEDEQKKRKRSKTVQCSKRKSFGHNAKTCKGGLTTKETSEGICVDIHNKKRKKKDTSIASSSQPTITASTPRRSLRLSSSQPEPVTNLTQSQGQ